MKINYTIAFIICIFLFSISYSQPVVIDKVIAVIGGKMVKQSEVEAEYLQLKAQGYAVDENSKCSIFEKILEHKLLVNQAMFDSIEVSESQVEGELNQRINYFVSQVGSIDKLEKFFNKSLQDIKKDLRESLKEQELAQKMQSQLIKDVEVTPTEIRKFYNSLPKDSIPRVNAQLELAQIAVYPPFPEKSKEDLKNKLLEMRKRIIDGERFATLATLYSEDEGSAKHGGEVGFLTKFELDPGYAKAAFSLNNPGDVSHVIESEMGLHLIQLIEKKGDRINTRHILMKPKPDYDAVIKTKHFLDSIANLIRLDSISFEKAVAKYSMDQESRFNKGILVNQGTGDNKFETEQISPADYNAIKSLKVEEISNSYESRDKNGIVYFKIIKILSSSEAHLANLKQDYSRIEELAKINKRQEIINNWYSEKRKNTFIHIDNSFRSCTFKSDEWFKTSF